MSLNELLNQSSKPWSAVRVASCQVEPVAVSAAYNLGTSNPYGGIFVCTSAGTSYVLSLPTSSSASAGVRYKVILAVTAGTNTVTVTCASANLYGSFTTLSTGRPCAGLTNLIIGATATRGDWVELYSDGVAWYVSGMTAINSAITAS